MELHDHVRIIIILQTDIWNMDAWIWLSVEQKTSLLYCKGLIYMFHRDIFKSSQLCLQGVYSYPCKIQCCFLFIIISLSLNNFFVTSEWTVWNFVSFREAVIYVVILMLKSTFFFLFLALPLWLIRRYVFHCLLLSVPFGTKHRHW